MAIEHVDIVDGERHEPKGISTASVNTIYKADGNGSGSWQLETNVLSSRVVVKSLSDFPTPVAGIITLGSNIEYYLDGSINVGNNVFVMGVNSSIIGGGSAYSVLISSNTGNIFTSSVSFSLSNFALTATTGNVFSCTSSPAEFSSAYINKLTINSCVSVGTFNNWYSLFWDQGAVITCAIGVTFSGICNICIFDLVSFISGYTKAIDLDAATFNTCSFIRCGFSNPSATNHIVLASNSGNINSGYVGRIHACTFNASVTNRVLNAQSNDIRWNYEDNHNLTSSTRNAQGYMHTQTTTTITTINTPTKINGASNWVAAHEDQFIINSSGRATYIGIRPIEVMCLFNVSGTSASGSATYNFYIAKNSTTIIASKTIASFTSTSINSPATCMAIVTLQTNDYVELYVENTNNTTGFVSEILNFAIGEA